MAAQRSGRWPQSSPRHCAYFATPAMRRRHLALMMMMRPGHVYATVSMMPGCLASSRGRDGYGAAAIEIAISLRASPELPSTLSSLSRDIESLSAHANYLVRAGVACADKIAPASPRTWAGSPLQQVYFATYIARRALRLRSPVDGDARGSTMRVDAPFLCRSALLPSPSLGRRGQYDIGR